jgi:CubicO group peptidase (beta-lactamase class C family)
MENSLTARLQQATAEHVFPGCVLGIIKSNGQRTLLPIGNFTYEKNSAKVKEDAVYDLASVTKAIPGSVSLLNLIDEKKLSLEDRLVDYVPEFGNFENKKEVKIKHLLTYTLDLELPSLASLKERTADEILDTIIKAPLKYPPGSKYIYTNSTAAFFALVIEKVTGQTLDVYAEENFFMPLGMKDTTFFPEKFDKNNIVPTEIDEWRGRVIQGEVHDEATFILKQKNTTAIAGLFSTAPDLLNFLEMLLNKGKSPKDNKRCFSENIVKQMHTNQLIPQNGFSVTRDGVGLGWVIKPQYLADTSVSEHFFCKSGFTGTFVGVDPVKGIAFTLLSNRTYPKRPKDIQEICQVRKELCDIIFGA